MGDAVEPPVFDGSEVAIIGMACRFPGAKNVEEFWENLRRGVESLTLLEEEDLARSGVRRELRERSSYVRRASVLDDIESFDAEFFGYTPLEARLIDPQHRLFLECAWEAFEEAGYDPAAVEAPVGVFTGAKTNTYLLGLFSNRELFDSLDPFQIALGNDLAAMATRVSYKLDLRGPSYALHTACSTSLVAVHLACQSLVLGECGMALAGGAAINVPQRKGYLYQPGGILSPDGSCRTFDAGAAGSNFGNGVGAVLLKRAEDAVADGDHVYALIRGSAANNDGAKKASFTAPGVDGQTEVLIDALACAGVDAETISYVEAHGTATALGDSIEMLALTQAFRARTQATGFCALGSVKTNIGHLETAAGVAGLIKTALALEHGELPPSLHFEAPNPKIELAGSPFYVNTELREWPRGTTPRRAGVSSFGIGSTNAHAILEEAPPAPESSASRPWQLLLLSARGETALDAMTGRLADHLEGRAGSLDEEGGRRELADAAYTLRVGRRDFPRRRAVLCRDLPGAVRVLRERGPERASVEGEAGPERPVAFLLPGLGDHYVEMGLGLYRSEPVFRTELDRCAESLAPHLGCDLREVLYPRGTEVREEVSAQEPDLRRMLGRRGAGEERPEIAEASRRLDQTYLAQPAVFAVEWALARLWMHWGIRPRALVGYSLGELAAAALAGVLSLEDALALVARRARLIHELPAGAMLAVPLSEAEIEPRLAAHGLALAAVDGPTLSVAAGPLEAVAALRAELSGAGVVCRGLKTSHAFHSPMLEPAAEELTELVAGLALAPPEIPYLSNVTGTWISADEATDPGYWARHMCRTVRFGEAVGELLRGEERLLLEVGPGQGLGSFARLHPDCDRDRSRAVISSMPAARGEGSEAACLLRALGGLWCLGAAPRWSAFHEGERRRRVPLPTYPFERRRHWVEPRFEVDEPAAAAPPAGDRRARLRDWFYLPTWEEAGATGGGDAPSAVEDGERWVVLGPADGVGGGLGRALSALGADVVTVEAGEEPGRLGEGRYRVRPDVTEDFEELLDRLDAEGRRAARFVHLWTAAPAAPTGSGTELFRAEQRSGLYSLLGLARALGRRRPREGAQIDVVSTRVQEVTGEEPLCPERSTVLGACVVIPQEYPNLGCRHVDLPAEALEGGDPEAAVQALLGELLREPEPSWIAHRRGRRWVRRFEPHPLDRPEGPPAFREEGVYLITGGLGKIGLALARHLAAGFRARLVLTRRSPLPEREAWDRWLEGHEAGDPTSATIGSVRELERLGGEVLVASADVREAKAMKGVVGRALERFGALHGVIHAAGVLDPDSFKVIEQSDGSECELHFQPKAHGLYVLEEVLQGLELDFCLLFSSLSAILGGLGYAGYAAANLFMDSFARHRNRSGERRWISVDWDSWHQAAAGEEAGGLGTTLVELALSPDEGVETLERILGAEGLRHVVVSTGDLHARLAQWVRVRATRPAVEAPGLAGGPELERRMAAIWARVLGRDEVDPEENFFELGGNSLLGMQLISELGRELGVEVSPVMLFEAPTVARLAERLAPQEARKPSEAPGRPARRPEAGRPESEDVAVIAMVGRFPGAGSVADLWDNLCAGRETISFFSDEELLEAGVSPEALADPRYVKARPILEDVDLFDASFFGYSPRDAELMDPQHRLFLEAAWEALEEAGYDPERIGRPVGVYGGASISSYMYNIFGNPELAEAVGTFPILIGNEKDSVTTKVSYKLDLRGPSVAVQSFCSTSLVAVHLAARALVGRECDMALAGGVSIILPQRTGYEYQEGGIGSRDGHIRAFDADASGIVFGNGLGIVVLKRLADALADGDQVHAVIKGSAVNNDGSVKAGYTATSVDGQAELVARVLERTGIDPETIGYMEAHGSGTPLGDPIEVAALTRAFRAHTAASGFCALGSVKTNVGHLDRTAGVVGLIKAILTIENGLIPPTLNFRRPNPNIDFEHSPFLVNTEPREWPAAATPRRAGVNSLGLGGTNAHVLLEEAPELPPGDAARPYQLLLLSARSEAALERATDRLADHLERHADLDFADVAYTLQVGRKAMSCRRIAVCRDLDDGVEALRSRAPDRMVTSFQERGETPVTFLFPGLGGQYPGMARGVYDSEPVFRRELDRCAELLEPTLGLDLRDLLWQGSDEEGGAPDREGLDLRRMLGRAGESESAAARRLDETRIAHPVLFSLQYALAHLWMSWGVRPAALVGYSVGEYVAACLAGVLPLTQALELVAERARRIEELPRGAMTAVSLGEDEAGGWLGDELSLAAINGREQSVLAGPVAAVEALERELAAKGVAFRRLKTTHAFHSRMLEPLREGLVELIEKLDLEEPSIPYVSNVTGGWIEPGVATDPGYWAVHSVSPVRFGEAARELLREPGGVFLELGPGQVLGSLLLQHGEPGSEGLPTVLPSLRHSYERRSDRAVLLQSLGKLWLSGVQVDWPRVHAGERRRRVRLPTYPFERRRFWVEPTESPAAAGRRLGAAPRDGGGLLVPSWKRSPFPPVAKLPAAREGGDRPWLVFLDDEGLGEAVVELLGERGHRTVTARPGPTFERLGEGAFETSAAAADHRALVAALGEVPAGVVHLWHLPARGEGGSRSWNGELPPGSASLLALAEALGERVGETAVPVWVVAERVHGVTGSEAVEPAAATLPGVCEWISRRWPGLVCRGIDLDLSGNGSRRRRDLAARVVEEVEAEAPERWVAHRGPHRWVPTLEPVPPPRGTPPGGRGLEPRGAYLLVDGLGNAGFPFAEFLAETTRGRLVLLEPRGAGSHEVALDEERLERLEALRRLGAEVWVTGDGGRGNEDLRSALEEGERRFGRIRGVIYAAGTAAAGGSAGPGFGDRIELLGSLDHLLASRDLGFRFAIAPEPAGDGGDGAMLAAWRSYLEAFAGGGAGSGPPRWTSVRWPAELEANGDARPDRPERSRLQRTLRHLFSAPSAAQLVVSPGPRVHGADAASGERAPGASGGRYARPDLRVEYVAPRSEVEATIAGIWSEMLAVSRIGVHDSFLDLGGDSLLASRLLTRMREVFDLDLPVRVIFEASTVAELARVVESIREKRENVQLDDDELAEMRALLDEMSDEEVEIELARRSGMSDAEVGR